MNSATLLLMFRTLVRRCGGGTVATQLVAAATGRHVPSVISKMCSGQAAITYDVVRVLEDALGEYPITTAQFARIEAADSEPGDLRAMAARIAQDSGEAVAALISAFSGTSADPTRVTEEERPQLVMELRELMEDCKAALAALEATAPPTRPTALRPKGAA